MTFGGLGYYLQEPEDIGQMSFRARLKFFSHTYINYGDSDLGI